MFTHKHSVLSLLIVIFLITASAYAGTITVNSTGDTNSRDTVVTLREAIMLSEGSLAFGDLTLAEQAQVTGSVGLGIADIIDFSFSGTITPTAALPTINDSGTVIDASLRWSGVWPGGQPGIMLDGTSAGAVNGLAISGADNCRILGLFITNFGQNGVAIVGGAQSNTVGGTGVGNRNVISRNGDHGVNIGDVGTDGNAVKGNYIGTNVSGTAALGNRVGVGILAGAQSNTIGGTTNEERNIISGNNWNGVEIRESGTNNNIVKGNYIGTDVSGTAALGNTAGVGILAGAASNTIGGATSGERNILSGNSEEGVWIYGSGTNNNTVLGNYIGTDVSGTAALGNSKAGVGIGLGAQSNTIGGTTNGERNVISGNWKGVEIRLSGTNNNTVLGNYIGTDVSGTAALGNSFHGVSISEDAQSNTIGGATSGERNIISGNGGDGVSIQNPGTDNNIVSGNYIGTDVNGTVDLGNSFHGVRIGDQAQSNIIGGTTEGERNIISGNDELGVELDNPGTNNNTVSGNYIGTDVTGTVALGNSGMGILILNGPQSNTIGGTTAGERNIISGNDGSGVGITGSGTDNNVVKGNYIGTDVTGTADLGNSVRGVAIGAGAQSNTIGGTTAAGRNIISGNDVHGVSIGGSGANNNVVKGNYIGTDVTGTADLGNSANGVIIEAGAQSNTVGGTTAGERNIISGNDIHGVSIANPGTNNNVIKGNYIGTDVTGTADLGNSADGAVIENVAQFNTIGGRTPAERNIISGNKLGVIISSSDNNTVKGNYIGTDVNGTVALGNRGAGVVVRGGKFNTIGGATAGERNIISGNGGDGVFISDSGTDNNVVKGNLIGTDVTGTADLGNTSQGVAIANGAQSNTIGGTNAGEGNTIAFNDDNGVFVTNTFTNFNKISGNSIHDNAGLGIDLVNGGNDEIPAPTIQSNNLISNTLIVSGDGAGANASVEIFKADSSSQEGDIFLGSLIANGSGTFSGSLNVIGKGLSGGDALVATTTHTDNNTSEFSSPDTVPPTLEVDIEVVPNPAIVGEPLEVLLTLDNPGEAFTATVGLYGIVRGSAKLLFSKSSIPIPADFNLTDFRLFSVSNVPAGLPSTVGFLFVLFDDTSGELLGFDMESIGITNAPSTDEQAEIQHIAVEFVKTLTLEKAKGMKRTSLDALAYQQSRITPAASPLVEMLPTTNDLANAYPNPFNPETWIPYQLATPSAVVIRIYDARGRMIRTLNLGQQRAGFYHSQQRAAYWNGTNDAGEPVASGLYFYQLRAGNYHAMKKMFLLK